VLNSANLQGANLQGANVSGLKFDEKTTWPDGKKGSAGVPLDYTKYVYTDLLKKVRPENVKITELPPK